jgi:L-glyceraldehyde 3-phosphate reductase
MAALDLIVRQGKALYVGISSYQPQEAKKAIDMLRQMGTPCLIVQPRYSMFDRWIEDGLLDVLEEEKVGCITFSSLAQGLLTNKYLNGIPEDSRAGRHLPNGAITESQITEEAINKARKLNDVAKERGQSLAQMALAWVLKDDRITSVILGASKTKQVTEGIEATKNINFSKEELDKIDFILRQ